MIRVLVYCVASEALSLMFYTVTNRLSTSLTRLHNRDYIAHLDGFSEIPGGWLNHHWIQLGYQLADSVAGFSYSFFGTCIILFLMNLIPGLSLRASPEAEAAGIDEYEIGEYAVSDLEICTPITFCGYG